MRSMSGSTKNTANKAFENFQTSFVDAISHVPFYRLFFIGFILFFGYVLKGVSAGTFSTTFGGLRTGLFVKITGEIPAYLVLIVSLVFLFLLGFTITLVLYFWDFDGTNKSVVKKGIGSTGGTGGGTSETALLEVSPSSTVDSHE